MKNSNLFKTFFPIIIGIIFLFLFFGIVISSWILRLQRQTFDRDPIMFFATFIEQQKNKSRSEVLADIKKAQSDHFPFELTIIPESKLTEEQKATCKAYDYDHCTINSWSIFPNIHTLVRFPGEPAEYLEVKSDFKSLPVAPIFGITAFVLLISIIFGVWFAVVFVLKQLRKKIDEADYVFSELIRGNLKARFLTKRKDEVGEAMGKFNQMADEIERLVSRLQKTEKARTQLLQDLSHDLRTPIASLKTLLESVLLDQSLLDSKTKEEVHQLALRETEYVETLVEDLLFLSQVSEPGYKPKNERVNLNEIVEEEIYLQQSSKNNSTVIILNAPTTPLLVMGDNYLLRRVIRNALENAYKHARSEIVCTLMQNNNYVSLEIADNGEGFSIDAIETFGLRKIARQITPNNHGKPSIGLGSVIIKTVVEAHRGNIFVKNISGENKKGASLTLILPIH